MVIVILVFTMLAVMFLGGLWIRSQRKKLQAERERKLNVIAGIIEPVVKKPLRRWNIVGRWSADSLIRAKRREKRKEHDKKHPRAPWTNGNYAAPPPTPSKEEVESRSKEVLPDLVASVLAVYSEFRAALETAKQADRSFTASTLKHRMLENNLAEVIQQGDMPEWLNNRLASAKEVTIKGRVFRESTSALPKLWKEFDEAREDLSSAVTQISTLQERLIEADEEMSVEHRHRRQIAWSVVNDCNKVYESRFPSVPVFTSSIPKTPHVEAEALATELQAHLAPLLDATRVLAHAYNVAVGEHQAEKNLVESFKVTEPSKPTDTDVQGMVDEVYSWAAQLQNQRLIACSSLPVLEKAMGALNVAVAAINVPLDRLKELQAEQNKKRADYLDSRGSYGQYGRRYYSWDERRNEDSVVEQEQEPELFALTDASASLRHVAALLRTNAKDYSAKVLLESKDWFEAESKIGTNDKLSDTEAGFCQAVRAASRKLGFALGQRNAAQGKLDNFISQTRGERELREASLDDTNVEKFIRSHRKWCDDSEFNAGVVAARKKRWYEIAEQLRERRAQVPVAGKALELLLNNPDVAFERDAMPVDVLVAKLVAEQLLSLPHVLVEDPTPTGEYPEPEVITVPSEEMEGEDEGGEVVETAEGEASKEDTKATPANAKPKADPPPPPPDDWEGFL